MNVLGSKKRLPLLVFSLLTTFGFAADCNAAIYFSTHFEPGRIGRANNDGTGVDTGFLTGIQPVPNEVAVDDTYLYWSHTGGIARALLDGSQIQTDFIVGGSPLTVHTNSTHIYWDTIDGTIGRANLDGTEVDHSFIVPIEGERPVAVTGNGTHLFWTDDRGADFRAIVRATIDGTTVEADFVPPVSTFRYGITANSTHAFWTDPGTGLIGRVSSDGATVEPSFLSGLDVPVFPVVDDTYIYWTQFDRRSVGRAKLDGSEAGLDFIDAGFEVAGIAINDLVLDPDPAASCPLTPASGCNAFGVDHAAQISFKGGSRPGMKLKLTRGDIAPLLLGDPTLENGTNFRVCVYIDDTLVVDASAIAGDGGFKLKPGKTVSYSNSQNAGDLTKLKMKSGSGNAAISAAADVAPPLPVTVAEAITVDIRSTQGCFTEEWSADDVTASTERKLVASK